MANLGSIKEPNDTKDYILKSTDLNKLDLIADVKDGSTAWCTDTHELYVFHMNEWIKQ